MFRVTHNGMTVKFFDTRREQQEYIQNSLCRDLNPRLVVETSEIIVYQYSTLYSEMFYIEELEF